MKHGNHRHHPLHPLRVLLVLVFLALASGTVVADDSEMWVQRWGIFDGNRLCDYDAKSGHLLISYRDGALLWDVKAGLALRRYLPLADSSGVTYEGCILDQRILLGGTHFISLLNKQSGRLIRSFDLGGDQLISLATNNPATASHPPQCAGCFVCRRAGAHRASRRRDRTMGS